MNESKYHKEISNIENSTEQLLSGRITGQEFINMLLALDQNTPQREGSKEVVAVLEDPKVEHYFQNHPELDFEYYNMLSLSNFHVGQIRAMEDSNDAALEYFEKALDAAKKVQEKVSGYEEWTGYVQGVIYYFHKDIAGLSKVYDELEDGTNKRVLGRHLQSLKEIGRVDYNNSY